VRAERDGTYKVAPLFEQIFLLLSKDVAVRLVRNLRLGVRPVKLLGDNANGGGGGGGDSAAEAAAVAAVEAAAAAAEEEEELDNLSRLEERVAKGLVIGNSHYIRLTFASVDEARTRAVLLALLTWNPGK
jgi:uncharacterized glyoxalase superfamily metalloenzyme YdcJ